MANMVGIRKVFFVDVEFIRKGSEKLPRERDQKFSHPRGKWHRSIYVAVLDLWLLSQMSITCRAQ
jgi:hypothetical protein